ncbi:MAG: hypothetical protein H6625_09745 [Bdellovibrionaceae bacterium]|nr:hypothetical protein [Pseudobdellovibrionaceae bacterium]
MEEISPEFIERYQLILEREPKSKVFAPLAEAYRKMGLAHKAYTICKTGLNYHPSFAGGHIAMARALIELEESERAVDHLEKATELSPENILAYQTLGELLLRLKKTKEALKAYKMVLFHSPDNAKAQKVVKTLESLSAEDFPNSVFEELDTTPIQNKDKNKSIDPPPSFLNNAPLTHDAKMNRLERSLSLIDAYIIRNDNDKAFAIFEDARLEFANHPELLKRLRIIKPQSISDLSVETLAPIAPRTIEKDEEKVQLLKKFLHNINKRRKDKIQY